MTQPPADDDDRAEQPEEERAGQPWVRTRRAHGGLDGVGYGVADRPGGTTGEGVGDPVGGAPPAGSTGIGDAAASPESGSGAAGGEHRVAEESGADRGRGAGGVVGAALQHAWGSDALRSLTSERPTLRAGRHRRPTEDGAASADFMVRPAMSDISDQIPISGLPGLSRSERPTLELAVSDRPQPVLPLGRSRSAGSTDPPDLAEGPGLGAGEELVTELEPAVGPGLAVGLGLGAADELGALTELVAGAEQGGRLDGLVAGGVGDEADDFWEREAVRDEDDECGDEFDPVGFVPGFAEPFYGAPARRSAALARLEWWGRAALLVAVLAGAAVGRVAWRAANGLLLGAMDAIGALPGRGRAAVAAGRRFGRERRKALLVAGGAVGVAALGGALLVVPRPGGRPGPVWAEGAASAGAGGPAPGATKPGPVAADTSVSGQLEGLIAATFDLVDSAGTVTIRAGALGGDLFRVATPEGSDVTPRVERAGGDVRLFLPPGVHGSPETVDIELNADVRWTLRLDGGAVHQTVDLTAARVDGVDLGGGAKTIDLTLPEPEGLMPVRMAGGVEQFRVRLPDATPVRVRVRKGAGEVTLGEVTHHGIAPGQAFTANGWRGKAGVDLTAEAGMGGLTVTDDDL